MAKYKEVFEWQFLLHHIVSVSAFYASSVIILFLTMQLSLIKKESIKIKYLFLMIYDKNETYFSLFSFELINHLSSKLCQFFFLL